MSYFVIEDSVYAELASGRITVAVAVKAKFVASIPETDYTNIPLPEDWSKYYSLAPQVNYADFRNELITKFSATVDWDALSDTSKKALLKHYVWDSSTSDDLDLLYSQVDRDKFRDKCMEALKLCGCLIILSSDDPDVFLNITCTAAEVLDPVVIATDVEI